MIRKISHNAIRVMFVALTSVPLTCFSWVGVNYSPFHNTGQKPGVLVPNSQILSDLKIVQTRFNRIKTYGVDQASGLYNIASVISTGQLNLTMYQGVYESANYNSSGLPNTSTKYLDDAVALANQYPNIITTIVVGNECLPGDSTSSPVSPTQLAADIAYVQNKLTALQLKTAVTTSLSFGSATGTNASALASALTANGVSLKKVLVNAYPFYGKVSISNAISMNAANYGLGWDLQQFNGISSTFGGVPVEFGETGWPGKPTSAPKGNAVPSVQNEKTYVNAVVSNFASGQTNAFLYEAFDEPWLSVQNVYGPNWGLWKKTGVNKAAPIRNCCNQN